MDRDRVRISFGRGLRDLAQPTVGFCMSKEAPNHDNSANAKSRYLQIILWAVIVLVAALIGGWTIWAGQQPEIHSIWAPD
jgi:hypothetical protein